MVIFRNNLQRLWSNKMQLVFVLLFPIVFMLMGTVQTNSGIKVVLLDQDQTALTQWMVKIFNPSLTSLRSLKNMWNKR